MIGGYAIPNEKLRQTFLVLSERQTFKGDREFGVSVSFVVGENPVRICSWVDQNE